MTAPRVYAFDSGSVRAFRGRKESRPKDEGELFEHLALNELHAHLQQRSVRSRRTKRGEERGAAPIAIECRRQADEFDPKALQVLRSLHAGTRKPVVARDLRRPYERRYGATQPLPRAELGSLRNGPPPYARGPTDTLIPMPLYRYRCPHCDHAFEELVSAREAATATAIECPNCGKAKAERELSTFAVRGDGVKPDATPFCGRCGENRPPCGG